jgi:prolyl oligopeptidase PreP (S9A serine peptidase family)
MSEVDGSLDDDPFVWLEEVDGQEARAWVGARNAETKDALCDDEFERDQAVLLDILNAHDRIPWVVQRGGDPRLRGHPRLPPPYPPPLAGGG